MDHAYVDGSVQGTGSAGYVPAGTSVVGTAPFVLGSAPEAATAVVPVGPADLVPARTGFQVSSVGYVPASYVFGVGAESAHPSGEYCWVYGLGTGLCRSCWICDYCSDCGE